MARKKGKAGVPDFWDELKKGVRLTLTPTAVAGLDSLAVLWNTSRSDFVERVGRGLIPVLYLTDEEREQLESQAKTENIPTVVLASRLLREKLAELEEKPQ